MDSTKVASWDRIAEDWAPFADTNDFQMSFLVPETLRLVGDVQSKKVLDLGCGEGKYARALARQGAQVTAVDASPRMISIAEERAANEGVTVNHLVLDFRSLEGVKDQSFDMVLAAMALMQEPDDYARAIQGIRRVLSPSGRLLMSIAHPCFTSRGCGWQSTDDADGERYGILDYYDRRPWEEYMSPGHFQEKVTFDHMPLQDYMAPLLASGFRLKHFSEPIPGRRAIHESYRLSKLTRVPLFLFMEWQREG